MGVLFFAIVDDPEHRAVGVIRNIERAVVSLSESARPVSGISGGFHRFVAGKASCEYRVFPGWMIAPERNENDVVAFLG